MNQKSARIIATYFGLGLSKIAPGTMGSLGTLPLAYALIYFGGFWALMAAPFQPPDCDGIVCTGRESYGNRY